MNHIDNFKNKLDKLQIQTHLATPSRCHQIYYKERQNMYGLSKSLSFYNNSTNDQYKIICNLNNNFYSNSDISIEIKTTKLTSSGLISDHLNEPFFQGSCEEANEVFDLLKKHFYDPHVKIPVPPRY